MTDPFLTGAAELAEEARRLLTEIDGEHPAASTATADCRPALDVIETATSIDVLLDIPGVPPDMVRIVVKRNTLLVVGAKPSVFDPMRTRLHIAERAYGRFARVVRLHGAFDAARARAVVRDGQLRISLPVLAERRGGVLVIPVERA